MDRNLAGGNSMLTLIQVALRKESVDRNILPTPTSQTSSVALRKESVDRNSSARFARSACVRSLSARRAWIEIMIQHAKKKSTRRRSPQGERG